LALKAKFVADFYQIGSLKNDFTTFLNVSALRKKK